MKIRILFALTIAALVVSPLSAFGPQQNDPIKQLLFPPDLIMKHRAELELDDQQQVILKTELQRTQAAVFDLRWQMKDEAQSLARLLKMTPVDETELLAQADKVMALEHQIKRTHLTLLARLKNMLSEQQIEMLQALREP